MMEKALKERIVGAIVLVAVAVLVVPVFLDGPPSEGEIISERVPLPGQGEQKLQTVVLDRDRDEPVPAQASSSARQSGRPVAAATTPAPQPLAQQDAPEVQPEPERATAKPIQSAGSTTGMWAVQLGSFANQENAEKLAADLRKQGFPEPVVNRVRSAASRSYWPAKRPRGGGSDGCAVAKSRA